MELIKTDKEIEQEELIRNLEAQVISSCNTNDRNSSILRDLQRKIAAVETYLGENYDDNTEEHFTAIAEMLDISLLKEYELQVTFTTTVKATAPIGWIWFGTVFDVTVDSNDCEVDINDYTVDSVEVDGDN